MLDNISREIFSKVFRADANWELAEGYFVINFDEEAIDEELILILSSSISLQKKSKKSFAIKGAQLTNCGFWVSLAMVLKRNLGLCLLVFIRLEKFAVLTVFKAHL